MADVIDIENDLSTVDYALGNIQRMVDSYLEAVEESDDGATFDGGAILAEVEDAVFALRCIDLAEIESSIDSQEELEANERNLEDALNEAEGRMLTDSDSDVLNWLIARLKGTVTDRTLTLVG
jgi:hypothetical protein